MSGGVLVGFFVGGLALCCYCVVDGIAREGFKADSVLDLRERRAFKRYFETRQS